jgi:hypothetical protein
MFHITFDIPRHLLEAQLTLEKMEHTTPSLEERLEFH